MWIFFCFFFFGGVTVKLLYIYITQTFCDISSLYPSYTKHHCVSLMIYLMEYKMSGFTTAAFKVNTEPSCVVYDLFSSFVMEPISSVSCGTPIKYFVSILQRWEILTKYFIAVIIKGK